MIKYKICFFLIIFIILNLVFGCSKIRDSAGVNRKSPDEFTAIENPPLIIPPDYDLVSPEQLQTKTIDNIETELAEEILFGLEEENNIIEESQFSTMSLILSEANATNASNDIRDEINENFSKEINTKGEFLFEWEDEKDVLDAVKESERLRKKNFNNESIADENVPTKKQKVKKKKKKRFFIF